MPWNSPRPTSQTHEDKYQSLRFEQEIYDRNIFGSFQWTPPPVAGNSSVSFVASATGPDITTTNAKGLRIGAPVNVSPPSALPAQTTTYAFVGVDNTLTVVIVNPTAAPITAPSGLWSFSGVLL